MTGLLFAPIEVFMNKELVIILMEILRLYEDEDYQPRMKYVKRLDARTYIANVVL